MARGRDIDSAGSQFFICVADAKHLNNNYTAFGKVIDNENVLDIITNIPSETKQVLQHSRQKIPENSINEDWLEYVYEGKKGNYSENDPVKPFNNYGLSKLAGECATLMYNNSLVLRIAMTEKPFLHNKAFSNLKTNLLFHEDLVKILPKLINKKGIINIGGPSQSVFSFVKKNNPNVKKIFAKKNYKLPLNQTMNLAKLRKILVYKK